MDTEYCSKCGLLDDFLLGSCIGCEMVAELKAMKQVLEASNKHNILLKKYVVDLKSSNNVLRTGLKFYGEEANYEYDFCVIEGGGSQLDLDHGATAREALAKTAPSSGETV